MSEYECALAYGCNLAHRGDSRRRCDLRDVIGYPTPIGTLPQQVVITGIVVAVVVLSA